MNTLRLAIVSCGFLGLSPVAPGTVGTLGGVLIAWALAGTQNFLLWIVLICAGLYLVGRALGPWAETYAGGKDPGFFVLDEVIGYLICVAWVRGPSYLSLTVAFFAFRFFDVLKPGWVRRAEAIGGGDGILLDDVVAGLYGLAVVATARLLIGDSSIWDFGGAG
jgi:phosphatidylglycerophosphatase A